MSKIDEIVTKRFEEAAKDIVHIFDERVQNIETTLQEMIVKYSESINEINWPPIKIQKLQNTGDRATYIILDERAPDRKRHDAADNGDVSQWYGFFIDVQITNKRQGFLGLVGSRQPKVEMRCGPSFRGEDSVILSWYSTNHKGSMIYNLSRWNTKPVENVDDILTALNQWLPKDDPRIIKAVADNKVKPLHERKVL